MFTNLLLADEINRTPPEDPVGAARVDGGAPGHRRRHAAAAARSVLRHRDPEPGRVRGHLSAARGAARPVPAQGDDAAARSRHRGAGARRARGRLRSARPGRGRRHARSPAPPTCAAATESRAQGVRRARDPRLRRRAGPGDPRRPVDRARRLAARRHRAGRHRARLGLALAAASSSRPTTCRRWPGRPSGTGSRCGPRPSSKACRWTGCSTRSSPRCPRPR